MAAFINVSCQRPRFAGGLTGTGPSGPSGPSGRDSKGKGPSKGGGDEATKKSA